ncbi:HNH endonuclease [Macrococcus caseolyticus]|uniref:HNH endonuclease n=1 Tax=Macrococcoides caseolyticum TaxID=69966 RepID=UPI0024BC8A37|nr:HNH endonuclease [Macrococcus caseolyticus]MDJ1154494.1 HNH endonuclease [Macrococcus caseolyticus]
MRHRFYKSKAWQHTRSVVLARDNRECQECKRNGVLTLGDESKHKSLDVDHILPLATHPHLAHDLDNLETLCIKCHNKKEKRFTKKENKWRDERW